MKKTGFFNGKSLRIITIMVLFCVMIGTVSADNNTTLLDNITLTDDSNQTLDNNESVEEDYVIPYIYTEQYQIDLQYWYDYHKSLLPSEAEQKLAIRGILTDTTLNNETKFTNVLTYIGLTDEYKTMVDETKHTIDEYSGTIIWDLGFGNWWGRIFGGGVNEDDLPDTIAEMNAIKDIYHERYNLYSQVEWEMMFGDDNN